MTNVASACGYTRSNYTELVALHDKYHKQGLEIVAFPCNQARTLVPPLPRGALTSCSVRLPVWPPGERVSG
jgi:glutathione peroxidase-family protein